MIKNIIVSDKTFDFLLSDTENVYIAATDFIANSLSDKVRDIKNLKIINLCSDYDYLSQGYYVSLLAEARGMRCTPSVSNIVNLNWKRHYQSSLPELNSILDKNFRELADEPLERAYTVYFGRTEVEDLEPLARRIFDLFRFPLMRVKIRYSGAGKWQIDHLEPMAISDVPPSKKDFFLQSLTQFTGSAWRTKAQKQEKYWIAVLHDPEEKNPPSDVKALRRLQKVARDMNIFVEMITKNDYAMLLEYDALFIRETTAINSHTYRFAHKAESEGIPCIDDTQSIIRCCNKVFQHELLTSKRIPQPYTVIIDRKMEKEAEAPLSFPAVVKIPDGSFSRGVIRVDDMQEFRRACQELLKKSAIIIAQEFIASDFDWRIGVLNGEGIYACKYYMAQGHWQIYNHEARTVKRRKGDHETLPIEKVPPSVLKTALRAAKAVGNGFYGVDLKEVDGRAIVMEVNDNPSIDFDVEDRVLGDDLYRQILERLIEMVEE